MENNNLEGYGVLYDLPYRGVDWKAVTSGEPVENDQLMELLMKYMPRDELSAIIEALIHEKLELNSDILEAMKVFARQLETIIGRDGGSDELNEILSKLADIVDMVNDNESALRDDFDEHNSDFDAHLNDLDRNTLDSVEDYREAVGRVFNETAVVRERVESDRAVLDNQIDVLTKHMADRAVHFDSRAQKDSALAMRIIEFTDNRNFPLVFTPNETEINSNRLHVRIEQLVKGSYVSRNDTVSIASNGTIRVQAIKPFAGRITIITDFKQFWR